MDRQTRRGMSVAIIPTRSALIPLLLALVATLFCVTPAAALDGDAPRIAPPGSQAYGKTSTEWLETYFRWYSGTAQDPAQSVVGRVQLMPIPAEEAVGGSGTPEDPLVLRGELSITLTPGTPFVLPLVDLAGERYEGYPGVPDDDPALASLATMSANLTIDGRTVVSNVNEAAFTTPLAFFDPIVTYPEPTGYGSVAAVWFEGIVIVSPPLPVGVHVMHLDATLNVPGIFALIFDNTWTVTVTAH